jgi:hypothetical protein
MDEPMAARHEKHTTESSQSGRRNAGTTVRGKTHAEMDCHRGYRGGCILRVPEGFVMLLRRCIIGALVLAAVIYFLTRSKSSLLYQRAHSNDGFQQPV